MERCAWCQDGGLMEKYHDEEWGIPLHDDRKQFEFLMLEVMQCGLSWALMIKKREIFRECFAGFDYEKIASFRENEIQKILDTPGMIRSRRKVEAVIRNAQLFLDVIREFGSFSQYIWGFTGGKTLIYRAHHQGAWEASNELSDRISRDLRKRGFKYLGSITVYSHLQACGIINDHDPACWMYPKLAAGEDVIYV